MTIASSEKARGGIDLFADSPSAANCQALLFTQIYSQVEAAQLFEALHDELEWSQRDVVVFGKRYPQPRLVAWYGDPGALYGYSGLTLRPITWTPLLSRIKGVVEQLAETRFNSVLANLYRDGADTNGWHSDNEPELGAQPIIASVSFGAVRRFDLRHRKTRETIKTELPAGSVLVMAGETQRYWLHQVPRTKKVREPRINLTFRTVYPPSSSSAFADV